MHGVLQKGAQVNAADQWGFTPLHEAARKGKQPVCITLLQRGADPALANAEGETPLRLAQSPAIREILSGARGSVVSVVPVSRSRSQASFVVRHALENARRYISPAGSARGMPPGRPGPGPVDRDANVCQAGGR